MSEKDLAIKEENALSTQVQAPMGFEDEDQSDMIIPRVKMVNALSPERKDKVADEGDIVNSLTKEKLNGKTFIPVFKFTNHIEWKDRADGGGIKCIARDGKVAEAQDGSKIICASCKRCEFDNTKQGKEALPKCTKYINFFGFIAGEKLPIILSFAKTNYAEGKKMYSLAKVTMQNMWNHGYTLNEKKMAKGGNEWYNIVVNPAGATSEEDRQYGHELFMLFRNSLSNMSFDMEETYATADEGPAPDLANTEF